MYIDDAVGALASTLLADSGPETELLLAHGRNRQAEPSLLKVVDADFHVQEVSDRELHEVYQTTDVTVLRLRRKAKIMKAAAYGTLCQVKAGSASPHSTWQVRT